MFKSIQCVKIVRIQRFPGPYVSVFGLNTEIYRLIYREQQRLKQILCKKCPKRWPEGTL